MVDYTPPTEMDDKEIQKRYKDVWHKAVGNFKTEAEANLLAIEMNRRFLEESEKRNEKLIQENHNLSVENHKLTKFSIIISTLALFFASTSAVFSYIDWKGDHYWQSEQIDLLKSISDTQVTSTRELLNYINTQNPKKQAEEPSKEPDS